MGLVDIVGKINQTTKVNPITESVDKQARVYFEYQLKEIGLSKNQVETQSLEELKRSLDTINEAIKHPESFGTLSFKISSEGYAILTPTTADAHFERGILQILLSRKRFILERIELLSANAKIESIQDLINKVTDEEVKVKLEQEIINLRDEARHFREQTLEIDQEQTQQEFKTQTELARLEMELFERRSKIWFSLLERESAATILGGILLLIILVTHVAAIFAKFPIPEILNNAFLIILGYFFGQSTKDKR